MRIALLMTTCVFTGCVANETLRAGAWRPLGYEGYSESIDALVGPEAIDCGFHDLTSDPPLSGAERRAAVACVREAKRRHLPFKFGTLRIPIDSYAYEVLARDPHGRDWMIVWDLMLADDESGQQWNRVCKSVTVAPGTLVMTGSDCVEHSTGKLKP